MSEACEESACQVSQGRGMAVLLREPKEEAGGCGLGPWTRQTAAVSGAEVSERTPLPPSSWDEASADGVPGARPFLCSKRAAGGAGLKPEQVGGYQSTQPLRTIAFRVILVTSPGWAPTSCQPLQSSPRGSQRKCHRRKFSSCTV